MDLAVHWVTLTLVFTATLTAGCRSASSTPDPQWLADFQNANRIAITSNQGQQIIADPNLVARLEGIYRQATWKPYRDTLPGDLGERTIVLLDRHNELRRFNYTGTLWESNSYTEQRTAVLSEGDRKWLESLFVAIPAKDNSATAESSSHVTESESR